MADADDTAKGLIVLNLLGNSVLANRMIEEFEVESHFRTYPLERDSSFSANCNVLLALLYQPQPANYAPQIKKTLAFLCDTWWQTDGPLKDKWVSGMQPLSARGKGQSLTQHLVTESVPSVPEYAHDGSAR